MWDAAVALGYTDADNVPYVGPYSEPFAILECDALPFDRAELLLATVDEDVVIRGEARRETKRRRAWRLIPARMTQAERLSITTGDQRRRVSLPKLRSWTVHYDANVTFDERSPDGLGGAA